MDAARAPPQRWRSWRRGERPGSENNIRLAALTSRRRRLWRRCCTGTAAEAGAGVVSARCCSAAQFKALAGSVLERLLAAFTQYAGQAPNCGSAIATSWLSSKPPRAWRTSWQSSGGTSSTGADLGWSASSLRRRRQVRSAQALIPLRKAQNHSPAMRPTRRCWRKAATTPALRCVLARAWPQDDPTPWARAPPLRRARTEGIVRN